MNKKNFNLETERYDKRSLLKIRSKNFRIDNYKSYSIREHYEIYFKLILEKPKDLKILEICCGSGESSKPIIDNFKNITFTDISKHSLDLFKLKYKKKLSNKIIFKIADIENLPFHKEHFDLVICAGGLSYGDNLKVLNEIYRILKKGGSFVCIDSLNENPIYIFNRFIHFLKKERSYKVITRIPDLNLIKKYNKKFGRTKIIFKGSFIWLTNFIEKFFGYKLAENLSNFLDKRMPPWMAFKFIMEVNKIK